MMIIRPITSWMPLLALLFIFPAAVLAHEGEGSCRAALGGHAGGGSHQDRVQLVPSGRDQELIEKYRAYLNDLFLPNGTLDKLGLLDKIIPQVYVFVPGNLMSVLAATNRFPIAHWLDGATVAQARAQNSGILELVYPGGQPRTAVYRDDMDPMEQVSVINHVIGHVLFGVFNKYQGTRDSEAVSDSLAFHRYIDELYRQEDPEEVQLWYYYLRSLAYSQDILHGVYQTPTNLLADRKKAHQRLAKKEAALVVPPTRNLLQYVVASLPPDLPDWKIEMARRYEPMERYIPGAINTKIMNEGLAMLMMEVLLIHAGVASDFSHYMQYCCFTDWTRAFDLQNPYFMGKEGWRNIRARFHQREEIRQLPLVEKDRRFFEWALPEVVGRIGDDRDFLPYALDQEWFSRHNVVLARPATEEEIEKGNPPPQSPSQPLNNPGLYRITSRNADDLVGTIVRRKEASLMPLPTPNMIPSSRPVNPIFEIENVSGLGRLQPLTSRSIVETLYVQSQLLHRPVALESTYVTWTPASMPGWEAWERWERWRSQGLSNEMMNRLMFVLNNDIRFSRIRTTVSPDGKVAVETVYRNGKTGPESIPDSSLAIVEPLPERDLRHEPLLTSQFQVFLAEYLADLHLGDTDRLPDYARGQVADVGAMRQAAMAESASGVVRSSVDGLGTEIYDHAPTVPQALLEYQKILQRRLGLALQRAIQKPGVIRQRGSGGGVSIKVLPDVVGLRYSGGMDFARLYPLVQRKSEILRTWTALQEGQQPARVSELRLLFGDDAFEGTIGQSGRGEGDLDWGEISPQGSGGAGEPSTDSNGEPTKEPGQKGEGEGQGGKAGQGGSDPSYVDVPEDLWGQVLGEAIVLPNTRPLGGSNRMKTVVGRHARRQNGIPRMDLITREAMKLGIGRLFAEHIENPQEAITRLLEDPISPLVDGFKNLRSTDWIVKGEKRRPDKDINAVVYLVCDFSGSMDEWIPTIKKMATDLRALLLAKYSQIEIRFVAFDGEAVIRDSVEDFKKLKLGGGTSYVNAYLKTSEDMDANFPYNQWDRYTVTLGDLIAEMGEEGMQAFEELHAKSQFSGVVHAGTYVYPGWTEFFKNRAESDEYLSYVHLPRPTDYAPILFKKVFKNEE